MKTFQCHAKSSRHVGFLAWRYSVLVLHCCAMFHCKALPISYSRRKPRDIRTEYHLPSMWRYSLRYWSWIPRAQHDRPGCEQSNTMDSWTDILHQDRGGKYAKLFSINIGLQIPISHPVGAGVGGRSTALIWLEADAELTTTATHSPSQQRGAQTRPRLIIDSHFHVWRIHSRCCLTIFMRPVPFFVGIAITRYERQERPNAWHVHIFSR
jgi:hypothetical protein